MPKNDLKKAIIKKNTKKKKHETTMVAALLWVKHHQYSTSWTLALHHIEESNRRTGREEKLCK